MISKLRQFIQQEDLFTPYDRLLLGVSGGMDSVVLAYLVDQLENEFAIAHCNFNLRGKESDGDETFVANLADLMRIPFYNVSFNTKEIANERGISIEMAARDLRYQWFEQIRIQNNYDYILVAHHQDDVLETFILNLARGTGIRGLSGIKSKVGRLIRPLLCVTKNEIEEYANTFDLACRYDASNEDQGFKRNKVRHTILPLLEDLNPAFRKNLHRTISRLNETEQIYLANIEQIRDQLVEEMGEWFGISIERLKTLNPIETYLYELLRPFNFRGDMVADIMNALDKEPGNLFFSSTHRLVVDREKLIVTPIEEEKSELFYVEKEETLIQYPIQLKMSVHEYTRDFVILRKRQFASLDYDKLVFPLIIRKWNKGEYFKPLGLDGLKKLSDFFIDQKFSIPEKESTWILASGSKIVWIIGQRIDDRFKLTPETMKVLQIEWIET